MKMTNKRSQVLLIVFILISNIFLTTGAAFANKIIEQNEIFLWPNSAPGSEGVDLTEKVVERSKDPAFQDKAIMDITAPSIISVTPDQGKANGVAVLICAGGAYERVVIDKEGYDIAKWLNSFGVTAFILKYRLPAEGHQLGYNVPLQDAQRAIRIIRQHADKWGINVNKIGVAGFSAGGHLASTLATKYATTVYESIDSADTLDCKPNFTILIYPVISMKQGVTHIRSRDNLIGRNPSQKMINEFSSELHVNANTPPTFLVQAHDDGVSSENSLLFYNALKQVNVDAEIHIFRTGGHGFGIRGSKGPIALWRKLCEEWLISSGILGN